jgi:hypothetical protein
MVNSYQIADLITEKEKKIAGTFGDEYITKNQTNTLFTSNIGKLFKCNFAGEMLLDKFHNLQLLDYEFLYHSDCQFTQDDLTWFLLENTSCT